VIKHIRKIWQSAGVIVAVCVHC